MSIKQGLHYSYWRLVTTKNDLDDKAIRKLSAVRRPNIFILNFLKSSIHLAVLYYLGTKSVNCLIGNGNSYIGKVAVTKSNVPCQRWDAQSPHEHVNANHVNYFPDVTLSDASNFCRNPTDGNTAQPWCFTTDPNTRWEYCIIPACGK